MKGKKYIIIAAVNAALLLIFWLLTVIIGRIGGGLQSQTLAERWSADGVAYTQLSHFTDTFSGVAIEKIFEYRVNIDKGLNDNSVKENAVTLPDGTVKVFGRLWLDAYSGSARMNVSNDRASAEVNAVYTGGDFFLFHPLPLLSGNYYSDDDLMKDRVVIDEDLAWQLFGSSNVSGFDENGLGKQIKVDGSIFYIAGVVEKESGKAVESVYGDKPRIYIPYEAVSKHGYGITCYEACLPNPIKGLGLQIFEEAVNADEDRSVIIENAKRYSLKNLWDIIRNYSRSRIKANAIVFPYWENAARINETKASLILTAAFVALVFPVMTLIYLSSTLIKNRKILFKKAKDAVLVRLKTRREMKNLEKALRNRA